MRIFPKSLHWWLTASSATVLISMNRAAQYGWHWKQEKCILNDTSRIYD